MPSQRNLDLLQQISDYLNNSQAVYLVDHHDLSANDLGDLRAQIRSAGGQLVVVKNTLLQRALNQIPADHPCSPNLKLTGKNLQLSGTTAALFVLQKDLSTVALAKVDPLQPLKLVVKYAKTHELPSFKLGILNHQVLSTDQILQLANLPGQDQLRAQVVNLLASPVIRLVNSLNGNLQKFVIVLNEIKKQKPN